MSDSGGSEMLSMLCLQCEGDGKLQEVRNYLDTYGEVDEVVWEEDCPICNGFGRIPISDDSAVA